MTALHRAAWQGHDKVVKILLTRGNATVDQADDDGDTALIYAATQGHVRTMITLIEHGASLDHENKQGLTVWYYAAVGEHDGVRDLLTRYIPSGTTVYGKANSNGDTPLHLVAKYGSIDMIRRLLAKSPDGLPNRLGDRHLADMKHSIELSLTTEQVGYLLIYKQLVQHNR